MHPIFMGMMFGKAGPSEVDGETISLSANTTDFPDATISTDLVLDDDGSHSVGTNNDNAAQEFTKATLEMGLSVPYEFTPAASSAVTNAASGLISAGTELWIKATASAILQRYQVANGGVSSSTATTTTDSTSSKWKGDTSYYTFTGANIVKPGTGEYQAIECTDVLEGDCYFQATPTSNFASSSGAAWMSLVMAGASSVGTFLTNGGSYSSMYSDFIFLYLWYGTSGGAICYYKTNSGSVVEAGTIANGTFSASSVVRLERIGSTFVVKNNGTVVFTFSGISYTGALSPHLQMTTNVADEGLTSVSWRASGDTTYTLSNILDSSGVSLATNFPSWPTGADYAYKVRNCQYNFGVTSYSAGSLVLTHAASGALTTGDTVRVDGIDKVLGTVVQSGSGPYTYTCTVTLSTTPTTVSKYKPMMYLAAGALDESFDDADFSTPSPINAAVYSSGPIVTVTSSELTLADNVQRLAMKVRGDFGKAKNFKIYTKEQ